MAISEAIQRWWPLPVSLDLVRGSIDVVASAVLQEVTRFAKGECLADEWVTFESLDQIFSSVSAFTNTPTLYFVIPTCGDWTVLWNNCFMCDGYDSLCWCLTKHHALTTLHWASSDEDAFFQAGTKFTFRKQLDSGLRQRLVYCCKNDNRWEFYASGNPLTEEDVAGYLARRIRDRLNESRMLTLMDRLGARPWEDSFYQPGNAFRIERTSFPQTISKKTFSEFACTRKIGG